MAYQEKSREELEQKVLELRERLEVAEETLRAITQGEVDALVVSGTQGEQIFTLQSADYPYRRFIENMKEGAATVNSEGMILYCNARLTSWLKHPLEKIIGSEFEHYIVPRNQSMFQTLFQQAHTGVGKGELSLIATDGTEIPVQISISSLTMSDVKIIGLIVTDLTERKRNEEIIATQTAQLIQANNQLQQELQSRQTAEQALRESEAKLQTILDNAPAFIYLKDLQSRHLMVNRYCLEAFHVTPEQIIGKTNAEFFPPDIAQQVEANDREVLQTGIPYRYEEEILLDDEIHTQYSVKFPLLDNSGKPYAICGISTDISDRIHAQKALQESEKRLQLVLEGSGDGFWDWNIATGEVYYSPRYVEMLGYEVDEFPENVDTWAKLIHPDDQLRVMKILEAHLKDSSVSYSFEYRLLTKSEEWKWIADYGKVVVRDENGKPLRMAGTHKDISARKLAEKEWELQAVITRNMAEGICLVRADNGVIVYANPKFERMFGYEPGELNGKHVSIMNYADESMSAEDVNKAIRREVLQCGEATYEVHNVKKDGTSFWCRATTSIFDHPEYGKVLVAIQQDITEHRQAEDLIKASLKEKEVLLKEIHHRVKNNLQIVTSLLQMQSRRTKEPQAVEVLRDSQNRIASIALVHEKLYRSEDLANINFGQYIPDLITHLFDTYKVNSSSVILTISVENISLGIDTAIPCGLIINELVSNSLKYAFPAEGKGEIKIEFQANRDNTLTLILQDNGIGIPEEFDIETTHSLGLTLVQGLVEQLEGTIEFERNQGTKCKITFLGGKI